MVFLVIIAGGVVRTTQSGMGCPDWPKCFGKWIPPTSANQLPIDFEKYLKQQDIDHSFNVYHTWVEYINRLLGALLGVFILIHTIWSYRLFFKQQPKIFWYSFVLLIAVGFQGWLGKKVVDANLAVVKITLHMLVALIIAAIPVYIIHKAQANEKILQPSLKKIINLTLVLLLVQIILGTEVREQIDVIAKANNYMHRNIWIASVNIYFKIHRSFSLIIAALLVLLYIKNKKINIKKNTALNNLVLVVGLIIVGVVMNYGNIPLIAQPLHLLLSAVLVINLFAYKLKFQ